MKIPDRNQIYIDLRLNDWASWMIRIRDGAEGWPKTSLLAIMLEVGAIIKSSLPRTPFAHNDAEEIDFWIKRMGQERPEFEAAIRIYYLREKNLQLKIAVRETGLPIRTFYDHLAGAKDWLSEKVFEPDYRLHHPHFYA